MSMTWLSAAPPAVHRGPPGDLLDRTYPAAPSRRAPQRSPCGGSASAGDARVMRRLGDVRLPDDAAVAVEQRQPAAAERRRHDACAGPLDVVRTGRHARAPPQRAVGERV